MRILILIAIGLLIYVIIGNLLRKSRKTALPPVMNEMVRCHHCGLHILESEALISSKRYYCCQEHQEHDNNK